MPPERVICWPSTNPWAFKVTTPGLATEIDVTAVLFVAVIDITTPVAPDVEPDTTSPVVKAPVLCKFKCVNNSISNR